MIKTVFLASLAAVALCVPDADPAILYGGTKILTPPTPFIHNPPVLPVVAAPLAYGYGIGAGYGLGAYGINHGAYGINHGAYGLGLSAYGIHHGIVKRDADADPQLYGLGAPFAFASAGAIPHVPVVKSVEVTAAEVSQEVTAHAIPIAVGYHGLGLGAYGYHNGYGKRDADADPQFLGLHTPYAALNYAAHVPFAFASAGAIPHAPLVKSVEVTPAEINHEVTAHAIPVAYGFGGYAHHAGHFYG